LLLAKNLTGVAVVKARVRAETDGVSLDEAAKLNRIDQARESAKCVYTKKGFSLRRKSNRKLATAYALESVEASRKKKGDCESQMGDSISLQYQVQKDSPSPIEGDFVRLDKLAGALQHRARHSASSDPRWGDHQASRPNDSWASNVCRPRTRHHWA
jgi:hypothetical protein